MTTRTTDTTRHPRHHPPPQPLDRKLYTRGVHANERLIRDAYDAMSRGDGSALAQLLTADTKWIIHGDGSLAGTYVGPDQIFEFWKGVAAKTGGGLRLHVRDVLANDQRAVVLATVTGTRNTNVLEERQVVIFEIDDNTVTSATFIYERPAVYDAFWAER